MTLLKKYIKWLFKNNGRKYDLAEFLAEIFFLLILSSLFSQKGSFRLIFLMLFLMLNFIVLFEDIIRKILGKFNMKFPKWISVITFPTFLFFFVIYKY
ncbi:hypothetical protein AN960_20590 [Bacillus sp. FJAT-25509]|nr:hypothetical protein AN960_20590 [Bacillus sp. FJAT-25509]